MAQKHYCDGCDRLMTDEETRQSAMLSSGYQGVSYQDEFCSGCIEHSMDYWSEKAELFQQIQLDNANRLDNHRRRFFAGKKKLKKVK